MDDYEEAVLFTFALLESRLERIEYLLNGPKAEPDTKLLTVPERIKKLEQSLKELSAKTALLTEVQTLVSNHSDLLTPPPNDENGAGLDPAQKCAIVLSRAPDFASTASQLKSLDDQQIPQSDGFAKLAKLRPRIAEAEERHLKQALEIADLRRKSGMVVSRFKHIFVLGQARCWAEYHDRVLKGERTVRRIEVKKEQKKEEI
ncbi:hypothetical protein GQ43DRAFT_482200 [Delitschia confertaspora ATCC 74209]|uniref:Uncharacterized protein n=1 Tax=Delitschia confertaspora ATCC 74209 TaxID=1513339 RepID=A0A9P4JKB5_9PLEO|nr:hypothetical protein GQ43DRAFT_482200 [Delitschia confertaspora ATCC 74209]